MTHRLEELEYADGAVYMEDGRVVLHGDASSVLDFVEARQASYNNQNNSWLLLQFTFFQTYILNYLMYIHRYLNFVFFFSSFVSPKYLIQGLLLEF